jgi:hypothetical protein
MAESPANHSSAGNIAPTSDSSELLCQRDARKQVATGAAARDEDVHHETPRFSRAMRSNMPVPASAVSRFDPP